MRTRTVVYNDLLNIQAKISFALELPLFQSELWDNAQLVLDYGCGNAAFASRLLEFFPDKHFICVERDADLADLAKKQYECSHLTVVTGSYDSIKDKNKYDFVLLRHLTSYLPDRRGFCEWVSEHTTDTAGVLVIDADDEHYFVKPSLPLYSGGIDKFRKNVDAEGGKRNVRKEIETEWGDQGFNLINSERIIVNSEITNIKELMYIYMCLIAELDYGSPLPPELYEELLTWSLNPKSYIQYGLFGTFFARNYKKGIYRVF